MSAGALSKLNHSFLLVTDFADPGTLPSLALQEASFLLDFHCSSPSGDPTLSMVEVPFLSKICNHELTCLSTIGGSLRENSCLKTHRKKDLDPVIDCAAMLSEAAADTRVS